VFVRVPFRSADDSLNGGPLLRKVRSLRLTMIAGASLAPSDFSLLPLSRLRVTGGAWLKRADRPLSGIAGERLAPSGFVIVSSIGTQDRLRAATRRHRRSRNSGAGNRPVTRSGE
jgi:hypothetical protein